MYFQICGVQGFRSRGALLGTGIHALEGERAPDRHLRGLLAEAAALLRDLPALKGSCPPKCTMWLHVASSTAFGIYSYKFEEPKNLITDSSVVLMRLSALPT